MQNENDPTLSKSNDYDADIVIVGGGAAGMGLLYGLLLPFDRSTQRKPNFSIAIIERGGRKDDDTNTNVNANTNKNTNTNKREAILKDPKQWFQASHPLNCTQSDVATVYQSVPQIGLHNRKIEIPTGKGLGGGTNINASLVTRPSDDDFINWPNIWKEEVDHCSSASQTKRISKMMSAIETVEEAMRCNGVLSTQSGIDLITQDEIHSRNEHFIEIKEQGDIEKIKLQSLTCAAKKKEQYNNDGNNDSIVKYERVNAYKALIVPLLERNPELKKIVQFHCNVQAERLLIEKKTSKESSSSQSHHEYVVQGVECKHVTLKDKNTHYFKIRARRKVILCAGAILSPALLLVSGIGDRSTLEKEGIQSLVSSPSMESKGWKAVGENLRDHIIIAKVFAIPPTFWKSMESINAVRGWAALDIFPQKDSKKRSTSRRLSLDEESNPKARVFFKVLDGTSSSTIVPAIIAGYFYRQNNKNVTNNPSGTSILNFINHLSFITFYLLRIVLSLLFQFYPLKCLLSRCTTQVLLCLLNPDSKGSVKIRRKKTCYPYLPSNAMKRQNESNETSTTATMSRLSHFEIIVDPGYLTNKSDVVRIENSWRVLDSVLSSRKWFSKQGMEFLPGLAYKYIFGKDNYLRNYAADFGMPYYHWSGTVAMKTDDVQHHNNDSSFVVDERLNVQNVENLHVCDASIFPGNISGPLALSCMGLGFLTATLIIDDCNFH